MCSHKISNALACIHAFVPRKDTAGERVKKTKKVNRARHTVSRMNAQFLVLYEMWFKMRLIWKNFPFTASGTAVRRSEKRIALHISSWIPRRTMLFTKWKSHALIYAFCFVSLIRCLLICNRLHLFLSFVYRKIAILQQFDSKKLNISSSSSSCLYTLTSCFMTFQSLALLIYIPMNSNRNWYGFWYFVNIVYKCAGACTLSRWYGIRIEWQKNRL